MALPSIAPRRLGLVVALLLCGRLSATDYCYSITHGFDTGETTTSLLVPVTNFPEGHAALSQPCANYSAGDAIPRDGSWSPTGSAGDCAAVNAGKLWYAYDTPYKASANTGFEVSDALLLYFVVDAAGDAYLVVTADKPEDVAGGALEVLVDSPDLAGGTAYAVSSIARVSS